MFMFLIIWYVVGLLGCFMSLYLENRQGIDVKVIDIFLVLLLSVLGGVAFIITLVIILNTKGLLDKTLIKGKVNE